MNETSLMICYLKSFSNLKEKTLSTTIHFQYNTNLQNLINKIFYLVFDEL